MSAKILKFPHQDLRELRIRSITKELMEHEDTTIDILRELVNYWENLEEYSQSEYNIYFHLKLAMEWALFSNSYCSIIDEDSN